MIQIGKFPDHFSLMEKIIPVSEVSDYLSPKGRGAGNLYIIWEVIRAFINQNFQMEKMEVTGYAVNPLKAHRSRCLRSQAKESISYGNEIYPVYIIFLRWIFLFLQTKEI